MLKRVVTAVILVAVVVAAIVLQGWVLRGMVLAMMLVGTWESYKLFKTMNTKPVEWVGYAFCIAAVFAQAFAGQLGLDPMGVAGAAFAFFAMLGMAMVVRRGKVDLESIHATLFPLIYPGLFCLILLMNLEYSGKVMRTLALVLSIFTASACDTAAFFVGRKWGKKKLSPEISPNKSVEGGIAGIIGGVVFAVIVPLIFKGCIRWIPALASVELALPPIWAFAIFGFVAAFMTEAGDLMASMVKRQAGVKDYGNIFPGHGGVMDRVDSILFCAVTSYVFFMIAGI